MDITVTTEGTTATLVLSGKLTVATSGELEAALDELSNDITLINFDFSDLSYLASAGLRILVRTQKILEDRGGKLHLVHPNDDVMEVLDMTGLIDIIEIER